jgi:hypothetical protein
MLAPFLRILMVGFLVLGAISAFVFLAAMMGVASSFRDLGERGLDLAWRVILLLLFFMLLERWTDDKGQS